MKAIILLSGGLDSLTVMAMAKEQGYDLYALTFDYGQRHSIEVEKSKQIAKSAGIKDHKIIKLDLRAIGGSALTDDISVPKYSHASDIGLEVPITYVPARNTIFLSYALAFAEVIKADKIFLGAHSEDSANYPDCRLEYIDAYQKMANLAVCDTLGSIAIEAPLISLSKIEIIKEGLKRHVDYSNSISCYDPSIDGEACGSCHACLVRDSAFEQLGMIDPAKGR